MGFSRKEVHYWLETASDEQLIEILGSTKGMLNSLSNREQVTSMTWLRAKVIEEIQARKEAKQS
jgi:hypothetical protein